MIAEVTGVSGPKPGVTHWSGPFPVRAGPASAGLSQSAHLAGTAAPGRLLFFYDLQKAERELGLTQHRPVKDAIAEAYAWLQTNRVNRVYPPISLIIRLSGTSPSARPWPQGLFQIPSRINLAQILQGSALAQRGEQIDFFFTQQAQAQPAIRRQARARAGSAKRQRNRGDKP